MGEKTVVDAEMVDVSVGGVGVAVEGRRPEWLVAGVTVVLRVGEHEGPTRISYVEELRGGSVIGLVIDPAQVSLSAMLHQQIGEARGQSSRRLDGYWESAR